MRCPECGERLYRSRTRNFKESFLKRFTKYKAYRCTKCGWREMVAPVKRDTHPDRKKIFLFWAVALILALLVGGYAAYDLRSSYTSKIKASPSR